MPQIMVSLEKWLEGETTRPSILTRVYPLDLPEKTPAKARSMMISAGPVGRQRPVSIELPVGNYQFEAYLPNGDVATKTVSVHEGSNAPVVLRAHDSPHEWLSWQHLTGYSPTWTPALTDTMKKPVDLEVVTPRDQQGHTTSLLHVWKGESANTLKWTKLKVPPRPHSTNPMVDGYLGVTAYLYDRGQWKDGGRYYGLVSNPPAGPPLLAVLPLPWHQTDFSGDALVDVIVDSSEANAKGREWPLRISVVVRDNVMASVLGYLSSGDLPAAGLVAETAVDFLYSKGENPLAAAGGAYALVSLPIDPKMPLSWVPWLQNLRNRFPSLPDGAILDGWAHLNGIGRPPNVNEAAIAFVAAAERGVPFYSLGVKLLFEGFTRAEATIETPARPSNFDQAFEFARRMALRVDVRQPFTVVRLG